MEPRRDLAGRRRDQDSWVSYGGIDGFAGEIPFGNLPREPINSPVADPRVLISASPGQIAAWLHCHAPVRDGPGSKSVALSRPYRAKYTFSQRFVPSTGGLGENWFSWRA